MARCNTRHQLKLRVSRGEANRLRRMLRSEDQQTLSSRDVRALLKILDDVYPVKKQTAPTNIKQPLLLGIGIGIILVLGVAFLT